MKSYRYVQLNVSDSGVVLYSNWLKLLEREKAVKAEKLMSRKNRVKEGKTIRSGLYGYNNGVKWGRKGARNAVIA